MAKETLEEIFTSTDILDELTDVTIKTEGLIPGQTPLRITNDTMRKWSTIQGISIDKKADIPPDRRNFFFVEPGQESEVIKRQYKNYFKNPTKYGLDKDATVEDAVKKFDQENPQNKLNLLKQKGIDIKKKLKEFDISTLNPFKTEEAYAEERPSLDSIFKPETKLSLDTIFSKRQPLEEIFGERKEPKTFAPEKIETAKTQAIKTTTEMLKNTPLVGFTPEQIEFGIRTYGDIFQRPLAGLTALAVETPFAKPEVSAMKTFFKGVAKPEEYPPEKITDALIDAGMEPYSAASLATLGQFGYYLGMGRIFAGAIKGAALVKKEVLPRVKAIPTIKAERQMHQFLRNKMITRIQSRNPGVNKETAGKLADIMTKSGYGKEIINEVRTISEAQASKNINIFVDKTITKIPKVISKVTRPPAKVPSVPTKPPITPIPPAKVPPVAPEVAKVPITEPLIQEAKKYKMAEEFVEAQPIVYHGTNQVFEEFALDKKGLSTDMVDSKQGFFFTSSHKIAQTFAEFTGEGTPNVKEVVLDMKNPLIVDFKEQSLRDKKIFKEEIEPINNEIDKLEDIINTSDNDNIVSSAERRTDVLLSKLEKLDKKIPILTRQINKNIKIAKEKGHDSLIIKNIDITADPEITQELADVQVVFDSSQIKTKSQLTDIWNKAQEIQRDKELTTIDEKIRKQEEKVRKLEPTKAPEVKPSLKEIFEPKADLTKPTPPLQLEPKLPKLKNQAQIKREAKKKAEKEAMLEVKEAGEAKDMITEHIRQRRFNLNLATYETNLFTNELDRSLTKAQKETLPFLMEKTDIPKQLNRPDLETIYKRDKELLAPAVEKVKAHFDEGWKKIQENTPDMTAQQIENYVTHIWDIPRSKKAEITNWFVTQNRFLKKRYIDTLKDGIEKFGLKPKVLDISEIIRIHDIITNRVIENNKFVNWLSKIKTVDGTPLLAPSHLAPPDWVAIHHPALQKKIFVPGKEKLGEKISNELQDILTEMGVAIGRRISPVSFGKPTQVGGLYVSAKTPEIRLQRFFANSTIAHEIGHHIDKVMNLGDTFLNKYKDELYAVNKDRISSLKGKTGKYGQAYAESTSEQIAEFFALLFTDAKKSMQLAPGATSEILNKLNNDIILSKLVDLNFANRAKNLIGESAGTMINVPLKTHPDLANALRVIFDTPLRHPAITAYETANAYLKKASLTLSLFHPVALSEASIATMGIGKTLKLLSPIKIYKALVKNELPVYTDIPIAKEWIKHGLSLGATIDIPVARIQKNLNDIAVKTKNIFFINKMTQFASTLNKGWDKLLWDYYQSSLKLYGAEHLSRHIDPTKDITKQKREIAQLINDTYGGQNWEVLMMGPKSVQLMTWGLLSADWTVSALLRQPMAPTGAGAIHKETIKLRRKLGSIFWLKATLYFGIGINLLNMLNRKKDYEQNPQYYEGQEPKTIWDYTMLGNTIGRKTHLFVGRYEDGTERYVRWGKQFREIPEMFFDDTEISPISASLRKLGGKTAPVIQQVSTIMTGVSPSGYTQRDIYGKTGWDRVWGSLKTLSKAPIPFSVRNSLQADKEFNITDLAMPSSKGLSPYKAVNYFKIGIEKYQKSGDDRIVKEVYQGAVKNNLNAYGLFKSAMTILKAEKTKGINGLLKDIDAVEKAIKTEKDIKVKTILYRRKARLIKDRVLREQGLKLLDIALVELEYSK